MLILIDIVIYSEYVSLYNFIIMHYYNLSRIQLQDNAHQYAYLSFELWRLSRRKLPFLLQYETCAADKIGDDMSHCGKRLVELFIRSFAELTGLFIFKNTQTIFLTLGCHNIQF